MTDSAESKVREWALRTDGRDLTIQDAIALALAVDDDSRARYEDVLSRLRSTGDEREALSRQTSIEIARNDEFERRQDARDVRQGEQDATIAVNKRTAADATEAAGISRRVMLMWAAGIFLVSTIVVAIVGAIVAALARLFG
jgi:hypothetical protein